MNLQFDCSVASSYSSKSQIARVLTERWVGSNIYCPSCGNQKLTDFANNSPVADFFCHNCNAEYELKSKKDSLTRKIVDGAYRTMIERINSENNPNFFFLNYSSRDLIVDNFIVIPKHFFIDDIIEKRKQLGPNIRRAGWIGCNILLSNIPEFGKIFLIKNRKIQPKDDGLKTWIKTAFLENQKKESKGWIIEVMKSLDRIPKRSFLLKDVYLFEKEFQQKFPNNSFIKDKIRQQLQVLRDRGLIEFNGNGKYTKL